MKSLVATLSLCSGLISSEETLAFEPTYTEFVLDVCRKVSCGSQFKNQNLKDFNKNMNPFFLPIFSDPIINFANGKCSKSMADVKIKDIVEIDENPSHHFSYLQDLISSMNYDVDDSFCEFLDNVNDPNNEIWKKDKFVASLLVMTEFKDGSCDCVPVNHQALNEKHMGECAKLCIGKATGDNIFQYGECSENDDYHNVNGVSFFGAYKAQKIRRSINFNYKIPILDENSSVCQYLSASAKESDNMLGVLTIKMNTEEIANNILNNRKPECECQLPFGSV